MAILSISHLLPSPPSTRLSDPLMTLHCSAHKKYPWSPPLCSIRDAHSGSTRPAGVSHQRRSARKQGHDPARIRHEEEKCHALNVEGALRQGSNVAFVRVWLQLAEWCATFPLHPSVECSRLVILILIPTFTTRPLML